MLTEVHRQAQDNPIVRMSITVREGGRLDDRQLRREPGDPPARDRRGAGDGRRTRSSSASTARGGSTTARIRELNGYRDPMPAVGEKLVCLRNDKTKGLLNGGIWTVQALRPSPNDFVRLDVVPGGREPAAARRGLGAAGPSSRAREEAPELRRAPRVGRVHLRLRADRPQGAGLAMGRRRPVRRILRLPRAPQPLALYRPDPRGGAHPGRSRATRRNPRRMRHPSSVVPAAKRSADSMVANDSLGPRPGVLVPAAVFMGSGLRFAVQERQRNDADPARAHFRSGARREGTFARRPRLCRRDAAPSRSVRRRPPC